MKTIQKIKNLDGKEGELPIVQDCFLFLFSFFVFLYLYVLCMANVVVWFVRKVITNVASTLTCITQLMKRKSIEIFLYVNSKEKKKQVKKKYFQ